MILINLYNRARQRGGEGPHIEDFAFIGDIGACAYCQDAFADKDDDMMMMLIKVPYDIGSVKKERMLSQYLCYFHLQDNVEQKQLYEKERAIIQRLFESPFQFYNLKLQRTHPTGSQL